MEANRVTTGRDGAENPFLLTNGFDGPGAKFLSVAVVVDRSISLMGKPIKEINKGLKLLGEVLKEDLRVSFNSEITIISFGNTVKTEMDFRPACDYQAPELTVDGLTALNEAVDKALDVLEARKKTFRENGLSYHIPFLFLLTDGKASDEERESAVRARLREYIEKRKVKFFPMGIGEAADLEKLRAFYPVDQISKPVLRADKEHFRECFNWIGLFISDSIFKDLEDADEINLPQIPSVLPFGLD